MEKVSWIQNGSIFRRVEGNVANVDSIPIGIYSINFSPMSGWSLEQVGEKFTFGYKVYGLQHHFVQHVLKTFNNTKGNLGILLNGVKGTGKSVTAKVLANEFNLPVVIVKSFGDNNNALIEYLASFNFDCVFFLDEFEKTWSDNDSSILQIMDGVYTSPYRRIFLLTTNETKINDNLLSRPSRLRYVKEFGNLEQSIVKEYLEDNLKNPECMECIIDFIDTLQISTIDILKSIVEDINIHGFDTFFENKDIFNIKTANYYYDVLMIRFSSEEDVINQKYNPDEFCKDIKIFETVRPPQRYSYETDEEYEKAVAEYHQKCCRRCVDKRDITTCKSVARLKLGDTFGYYSSEKVIKVDIDKKVVITCDTDDKRIYFYYIKNPNTKPSLYSLNSYYTNPYFS